MTSFALRRRRFRLVNGALLAVFLALQAGSGTAQPPPRFRPPDPASLTLPVLDKITFSKADADGLVKVTGRAGAVPARARVFVLSLQTGTITSTPAEADGAFQARIPVPDGSTLVINHARSEARNWLEGSPAVQITVNPRKTTSDQEIRFTTAGGLPPNGYWIAAGSRTGSIFQPGDLLQYTLDFWTSPGIELPDRPPCPHMLLVRLNDASGRAVQASFVPTLLTPTGLPIFSREGYEGHGLPLEGRIQEVKPDGKRKVVRAIFTKRIPEELPAGHYVCRVSWNLPLRQAGPPTGRAEIAHGASAQSLTPILKIGKVAAPRIPWVLLGNTLSNGTRGTIAREDKGTYEFGTKVTFQTDQLILPRENAGGSPRKYRLEPYLPTLGYIMGGPDRPVPPLVAFNFPSGKLHVTVTRPDGKIDDLGKAPFRTGRAKGPSERGFGSTSLNVIYELTTLDPAFEYQFPTYGHYVVRMEGWAEDAAGNKYPGGGQYDVYVAKTLDLDLGTVLGTPFQAGDVMAPTVHIRPMVPAEVRVDLKLFPNSDPTKVIRRTVSGRANAFGYFHPNSAGTDQAVALTLSSAGEYVVDVTASYTDADGVLWMGAARGASVVESLKPRLVAHGKRGLAIPGNVRTNRPAWFTMRNIDPEGSEERRGTLPQVYYPYFTGDVLWATDGIASGIMPVITVEDPEKITQLGRFRPGPDNRDDGRAIGEIEVALPRVEPFQLPAVQYPELIKTWAYYYISTQRPGVTVRAFVGSGEVQRAYWQFDDAYNGQLGNGPAGDLPDDIKLQYGGLVYRDRTSGVNEYAIYGSMAVMIPRGTQRGMRTFPPFQGAAGGPNGGPLLTLRGKDIDLFFTPTGVMPGSILEVGDTVSFSGAVWPTLPSLVETTVITPSSKQLVSKGRANKIGYFHNPAAAFVAAEPGVYTVNVRVTHDGQTSAGAVEKPFPTGGVLGCEGGNYSFYVVSRNSAQTLTLDTPAQGASVSRGNAVFTIKGQIPAGWSEVKVHYTTNLTGTVLESGTLPVDQGGFAYTYDLPRLRKVFANLDPDPADTVVVTLVVTGKDAAGQPSAVARQVLFQGREVYALLPH